MLNSGSINEKIDMTDNEITRETLDNILIKTINTIRCNKKGPDVNSISEYHNEKLHNSNITFTLIDTRLSTLTIDAKLQIQHLTVLKTITCWNPAYLIN